MGIVGVVGNSDKKSKTSPILLELQWAIVGILAGQHNQVHGITYDRRFSLVTAEKGACPPNCNKLLSSPFTLSLKAETPLYRLPLLQMRVNLAL